MCFDKLCPSYRSIIIQRENINGGETLDDEELIICSVCGCINKISPDVIEEIREGRIAICSNCKNKLTLPSSQEPPVIEAQVKEAQFDNSELPYNSKIKKKFINIPGILLDGLVKLPLFRWNYGATKSNKSSVSKRKVDRWTNQVWIEAYDSSGLREMPRAPGTRNEYAAWEKRNALTACWQCAVATTIIYLLWVVFLFPWYRKKQDNIFVKFFTYFLGIISILYLFGIVIVFIGLVTSII